MGWWQRGAGLVLGLVLLCLSGCATVQNPDPRDPLESFNRGMFSFNDVVDRALVKPAAQAYQGITPKLVRKGVSNFFGNLGDVWSAVNNALALRGDATGDSVGRVLINTTIGIGGLFDVASELNIEKHPADFGLTLGRWGVGSGPYLVLPLLGPSTLRETAALPVNAKGNLINSITDQTSREATTVLNLLDVRTKYLGAEEVVEGAALDKYRFVRDAYLQQQRNRLYDGNPPEEDPALPEDDGDAPPPAHDAPAPEQQDIPLTPKLPFAPELTLPSLP
jgi:phospholipid-binding lipoprotein MlaA